MTRTLVLNELKHNLLSMRFIVGLLFILLVYAGSAIVFSKKYLNEKEKDNQNQQSYQSTLENDRKSLEALYDDDFVLTKSQELSSFFSTGDERRFPKAVLVMPKAPQGSSVSGGMIAGNSGKNYKVENYTEFDLTFIIGIVLSFLAIVLTFDTISGDREDGILKQELSNGVRRTNVLIGKYLAILIILLITIFFGSLLSIIIFQIFVGQNVLFLFPRETLFSVIASLVYLSIFVCLGLWISSSVSKSSTSLALSLLVWISIIVLAPNVGGMIARRFYPIPSQQEHDERFQAVINAEHWPHEANELFKGRGTEDQWRIVNQFEQRQNNSLEQFIIQRFNELMNQAEKAEMLSFFSPYGAFKQTMERIASTGLGYHRKFYDAARRYRIELLQFIQEKDWHDTQSKHHISSIPEIRAISNKPVDLATIPQFAPPSRNASAEDILQAMPSTSYLLFLNMVFFSLAVISISRMDVR